MLLRWYVRFFIWYRFLWQVSRIPLDLIPTHPDRAGGLGFLGGLSYTFGPILFGQGAMLAGLIASNVLYHGGKLLSFKLQAGSFVVFFVCVIFGPLLMFTSQMARARRKGLAEYGLLAQQYVADFWGKMDCRQGCQLRGTPRNGRYSVTRRSWQQLHRGTGNAYASLRTKRRIPAGRCDCCSDGATFASCLVTRGRPQQCRTFSVPHPILATTTKKRQSQESHAGQISESEAIAATQNISSCPSDDSGLVNIGEISPLHSLAHDPSAKTSD